MPAQFSEGIPLHSYDLIDDLDARYPEVIFDPLCDDRDEFLIRTGERRLVLALKARRQHEQDQD